VLWQASNQGYLDVGLKALAEQDMQDVIAIPVDRRPFGEASNIYDDGGQFISLLGGNPLFHHPDDCWPEAIDLPKTVKLNRMMLPMISALVNQT
jgi:hypothetical protein